MQVCHIFFRKEGNLRELERYLCTKVSFFCFLSIFSCLLQMLKEMQDEHRAMNNNPAELQAQAHASAVKRFTGGGFAVN